MKEFKVSFSVKPTDENVNSDSLLDLLDDWFAYEVEVAENANEELEVIDLRATDDLDVTVTFKTDVEGTVQQIAEWVRDVVTKALDDNITESDEVAEVFNLQVIEVTDR